MSYYPSFLSLDQLEDDQLPANYDLYANRPIPDPAEMPKRRLKPLFDGRLEDVTEELDPKLECSVCLESFIIHSNDDVEDYSVGSTPAKKLVCSHVFHEDCIRRWLAVQASCPMCRLPIPEDHSPSSGLRRLLDNPQYYLLFRWLCLDS
ncbi:ERAD-associated E3 ubiquitin-protein ligase HRD1B [Linum grandiflorum]